ncbi:tyrosine-protein kinase SYK-like, partial [Saccoglossus kowalevskii]|uniref:Tyrosine-protein kinase n=1 Tax=Saccoglossus kowalevskii TaxID=10224 RepID=A0ABM0MQU7_SACKO
MLRFRKKTDDPYKFRYFHGRITREEAEKRLKDAGCSTGLFLLREKLLESGSYSLSLCFNSMVYHYSIDKQDDGTVAIEQGKRFNGPIDFVNHHQVHLDGLLSKLLRPCNLPQGMEPEMAEGMSRSALQADIHQAAHDMGIDDLPADQLERTVLKVIHTQKPWFHGTISRDEAEKLITKFGLVDGNFLVRERETAGSFAIGLCYKKTVYHYKVDKNDTTGKLSIQDGQKFDSLFMMVDHYTKRKDGLLTTLVRPVVNPKNKKKQSSTFKQRIWGGANGGASTGTASLASPNVSPRLVPKVPHHSSSGSLDFESGMSPKLTPKAQRKPPSSPHLSHRGDSPTSDTSPNGLAIPDLPPRPLPNPPRARSTAEEEIYGSSVSNAEKIYDRVAKKKKSTVIDPRNLKLMNQLGKGNFGSVVKGNCRVDGQEIPVAVKTLKQQDGFPNNTSEIMKEAGLMTRLDNPYIVRMIGMCQGGEGVMMLVLELAELGPLNKYLKENTMMRLRNIIEIMHQVAMGMQYLEEQQFVHRDLAARNVLLVTETYAKISDFGMSKALGLGSDYYIAESAGKWPLKWYAPECIYRFKFSSKGDVWSYGVTLWEAMSFGKKPYA